MDCIVNGVSESWTRLRDLHFHFHVTNQFSFLFFGHRASFIQWPENGEAVTKFTDQLLIHMGRGI